MQPMMAIATPGRCPVRSEICAVTSCRSKSVRPHEGHETNSVLMLRIRDPCSSPKEVVRRYSIPKSEPSWGSTSTPSPRPSHRRPPTCEPSCSANSYESDGGGRKWWMTAESTPWAPKSVKRRREACRRESPSATSRSTKACGVSFSASTSASLSLPSSESTTRLAHAGTAPAATSARVARATAPSMGLAASSAAGTMGRTATSISRLSVWRATSLSRGGDSRSTMASVVAMSLKGRPTTVLQPSALYSACGSESIERGTGCSTEPSRLSRPR
mmetsp:Transcript_11836/g.20250  ORF Transcript_11836/g.20250 Transcript_11836/m.20250 type:complete len:273 (+) Transcript_11836:618-1436(+)